MMLRAKGLLCAAAISVLIMGAFAMVGCAGQGTLSSEIIDETGAYKVIADDAIKDSAIKVDGLVEIEKGQLLLVSPDLQKGSLYVKLTNASGESAFEQDFSGRVLDTFEVTPGTYDISVTCSTSGTTGVLVLSTVDAEEFAKQDADLEAALAEAGVNGVLSSSSSAEAAESAESASASAASETAEAAPAAGADIASYEVDYGKSELYTQADMDAAIDAIMAEFNTWKGAEMKSVAFTDDATCKDSIAYVNEFPAAAETKFDQAIVFTSSFHSPSGDDAKNTAWAPDTDYDNWTWYLARTGDGDWNLLTWGYA